METQNTVLDAICERAGVVKVVGSLDSKGSVWEVIDRSGAHRILKIRSSQSLAEGPRIDRVQSSYNEARILETLSDLGLGIYKTDFGEVNGTTWQLQNRIGGTPANLIAQGYRRGRRKDDTRKEFKGLFLVLARALAEIHNRGFLHGDIQPSHFLCDWLGDNTPVQLALLIDFELAGSLASGLVDYPGALVHFASPEIASNMLLDKYSHYSIEDEVHAFGATLFWLFTGKAAYDYGSDDYMSIDLKQKLRRIVDGKRATLAMRAAPDWPDFENLVDAMMASNRGKRPSLSAVIEQIEFLSPKY
jgi:serine/threonine protein kinase